jgi:hypothetical protein
MPYLKKLELRKQINKLNIHQLNTILTLRLSQFTIGIVVSYLETCYVGDEFLHSIASSQSGMSLTILSL